MNYTHTQFLSFPITLTLLLKCLRMILISMANEISYPFHSIKIRPSVLDFLNLRCDRCIDSCRYSIFMVIFERCFIHAPSFQIAMMTPWKCESESFKMHTLKDNVFIWFSSLHRPRIKSYSKGNGIPTNNCWYKAICRLID